MFRYLCLVCECLVSSYMQMHIRFRSRRTVACLDLLINSVSSSKLQHSFPISIQNILASFFSYHPNKT